MVRMDNVRVHVMPSLLNSLDVCFGLDIFVGVVPGLCIQDGSGNQRLQQRGKLTAHDLRQLAWIQWRDS